jgi:hypothetical protein
MLSCVSSSLVWCGWTLYAVALFSPAGELCGGKIWMGYDCLLATWCVFPCWLDIPNVPVMALANAAVGLSPFVWFSRDHDARLVYGVCFVPLAVLAVVMAQGYIEKVLLGCVLWSGSLICLSWGMVLGSCRGAGRYPN